MNTADVVIVGGGVIGLSIAYELARSGVRATVLDRDDLGRTASWAGAGIISPGGEKPPNNAHGWLRSRSAALFPEWSAALREETGIDNGYRRSGGVDVATSADEERALRAAAGRWREEGIACERLAPADFRRVEPALSDEIVAAYFLPDRAQIRNPRHLRALTVALDARGVAIRRGPGAAGFVAEGGRVRAIRTAEGPVFCATVVVAAGPWTQGLLADLGLDVATPPIKGQIVLLRNPATPLRRIVEHGRNYLVPRDDGRILVGATEEDAGFDTRTTSAAVRDLIDEAIALCPVLAGAEVERAWAGLRPGSLDTRPYIGRAPGFANVIVASGHRRAGLQQSPATAELVADLVLGRPSPVDLAPFRPGREADPSIDTLFRS